MESQTRHGHDTEELKLQQVADKLKQLPRKERSLRAQVEYLRASILGASILESLAKGYSYGEVTTVLAIEITVRQSWRTWISSGR
jgi:hypothetical protein